LTQGKREKRGKIPVRDLGQRHYTLSIDIYTSIVDGVGKKEKKKGE